MTNIRSILWRLALTSGVLFLLASCGIEQSAPDPALPTRGPSATSPPPSTGPLPTTPPTPAAAFSPTLFPSRTVPSQAPILAPTPSNSQQPERLTVTLADDGKTITLQVGDRFLLDLDARYSWQVTVTDSIILIRVSNNVGKDDQSLYEANQQGSTTLTATGTPLCYNAVPRCLMPSRLFTLHVNVKGGASPSLAVTVADNGKTIPPMVGQRFSLSLGQDYGWAVTVEDPNTVSRVVNATAPKGAQGIYEAIKDGSAKLHATGTVICPPDKAGTHIALEFRLQLVVKWLERSCFAC